MAFLLIFSWFFAILGLTGIPYSIFVRNIYPTLYQIAMLILWIMFTVAITLSSIVTFKDANVRIYENGFIHPYKNRRFQEIFIPFNEMDEIKIGEDGMVSFKWHSKDYVIHCGYFGKCYETFIYQLRLKAKKIST